MCTIAIAYRVHPSYPLIIAANRDEFYHRPTAPLNYWPDTPEILAGRDLKRHGTWLGMNKKGKIAAVTNYREPESDMGDAISRGALVGDYLANEMPPTAYLKQIEAEKDRYRGFNVIVGNQEELFWYSNRAGGIIRLSPGIHGISNHLLNTPWPKVEKIRRDMTEILDKKNTLSPEDLFALLKDRVRPPDEQLPDTGIGMQWERILSPVFISSDIYGTRSSSVIIADESGNIVFCERTFAKPAENTTCFQFSIP